MAVTRLHGHARKSYRVVYGAGLPAVAVGEPLASLWNRRWSREALVRESKRFRHFRVNRYAGHAQDIFKFRGNFFIEKLFDERTDKAVAQRHILSIRDMVLVQHRIFRSR